MKATGRLKSNARPAGYGREIQQQLILVGGIVGHLEVPFLPGGFLNQDNIPFLGDVDCNQIDFCCRVRLVSHESGFSFGKLAFLRMLSLDGWPLRNGFGTGLLKEL